MKGISFIKGAAIALTGLGLLLPPQAQAAIKSTPGLTVKTVNQSHLDLTLQHGHFAGRVVDHNGAPVKAAEVVIHQGKNEVARVQTDERGAFAVAGLKSGTYDVASGKTVGHYRVWTEETAPPASKEQALLVLGENGTRGNYGVMGGGALIISAAVALAIILSIIAIQKAQDAEDAVESIPKS